MYAAKANSLVALGRLAEADAAREEGRRAGRDIAASMTDQELHSAFLVGLDELLGATPAPG